jgi:hypothetical protein
VNTCQFHRNRKAVAALTNTVHLCEHCLRLAMPMLEARRAYRYTPNGVYTYLDECAAYVRTKPR